jgi:hypothetical protein
MPDQPADPRHYEMKIPPEPQHANKERESENSTADEGAPGAGGEQDANVSRKEDNRQPARPSSR